MRKAVKQIAVCAGLLLIFCLVCRLTVFRTYTAYIPLGERQEAEFRREGIQVEVERPEVLKAGEPEMRLPPARSWAISSWRRGTGRIPLPISGRIPCPWRMTGRASISSA